MEKTQFYSCRRPCLLTESLQKDNSSQTFSIIREKHEGFTLMEGTNGFPKRDEGTRRCIFDRSWRKIEFRD
jgi:hypothetical protein